MKRIKRYLNENFRPPALSGYKYYQPGFFRLAAGICNFITSSRACRSKMILILFLSVLFIIAAFVPPAEAYYLNTVYPENNTWVTKSPYTFQWRNNYGSGAYWGGDSAYWYYSYVTIYNSTWGYRNNDSAMSNTGLMGTGSLSQTLTESLLGSSYWRMRGYYRYRYSYQSYEYWYSYWVYRHVLRCGWWSWGSCLYYYWSWKPWYQVAVYHWVTRYAYTYAYTSHTNCSYFGVDLYAPSVSLTSPVNNYSACNNTALEFKFSVTDTSSGINTSTTYSYFEIRQGSTSGTQIAEYAVVTGNNTINHTITSTGTYYWRVVATDKATLAAYSCTAGARTTTSEWRSFVIDKDAPSRPALTSPINNVWLSSKNVLFKWNASTDAGTGVKGYYLKINKPDGNAYSVYSGTYGKSVGNIGSITITGMPETPSGNYEWWVYAEDQCNNKSLVSTGDGKFRIDATAPAINISNPQPAPEWYNEYTASAINFKAGFTDDGSGLKEAYLKVYGPGPVHVAAFNWSKTDYPAYTSSGTCNVNRDCKAGAGAVYNGVWRAVYDVKDYCGLSASANRDFQVDVTRPAVGAITYVDGTSVAANPITNPYPIVKTSNPVIRWSVLTEGAGQSGIANYYVKIWNSAGLLVANATLAHNAESYMSPALTTGLYYFEVSVSDKARNGAVQNVDGTSGNNQTFYTSQDTDYTQKRRFIVHLGSPYVLGYTPPLPKSGNGSAEWVVSGNPTYSGEMNDTYGISKYDIRVYRKTGASYSAALGTYYTCPPAGSSTNTTGYITTDNTKHIIPNRQVVTLTDGLYGFEIQAWDTATTIAARSTTIAPTNSNILKYDFKVDITPPVKGSPVQPLSDAWLIKPAHPNPKRPTFVFSPANDNQAGSNDDASFSNVKEYMIRLWWDPDFAGAGSMTYPEEPFLGQPYKDYNIGMASPSGSNLTWTLPDDLKNGRYYWDVWVKDNANNWRWYYNSTTGNYLTTSVYGNTVRPTGSNFKFRVDTTEPITNSLVSNIGDIWITVFNPSFVWKAGKDAAPGSGIDYYEMWLWGSAGGSPVVVSKVVCSSAPGNAAYGGNITLPYNGGALVSGAWPPAAGGYLANGRYYWDIKLVDVAGNYKWYKSGLVNEATVYNLGESFRVDKIKPVAGQTVYPVNNEWIDQKGTRSIDENTGDAIYKPNRKPSLMFTAARDDESGLFKYIIVLKDARSPKVLIGDQALTPSTEPSLFSLPYGAKYTFTPPWGTGTWPVELKDGKYFWEVIVIDNTKSNTSFYKSVNGNDVNYETFRLDTVPPTVAPNKTETIRVVTPPASTGNLTPTVAERNILLDAFPPYPAKQTYPGYVGVGELLEPEYAYVTTVSVNIVNFKFSKAVDDISTSFNGNKMNKSGELFTAEGPSGIHRYNLVIATTRDKLKEFPNVDIWQSGYTLDTTAAIINCYPALSDTIDAELNALTVGSLYWSVHVIDKAGNESQYVDRKMRIRHLPPGGGNLEAPPHGFTTTNRKPTFKWTK